MALPRRKTPHLARYRVSLPEARYFVTCCTRDRRTGLTTDPLASKLWAELRALDTLGDARLIGATLMPDHLHWIFTLGRRLTLSQVVGKWKALTSKMLTAHGLAWQKNYFEHRLRADESVEAYAMYVFMNPYRSGHLGLDEIWPWWSQGQDWRFEFEAGLRPNGTPVPEWLGHPWASGAGLAVNQTPLRPKP